MNRTIRLTRDEIKAIPFVLPGVLVTAALVIYPLFYIFSMSFSENALGQSGFAGITNYTRLIKNPQFFKVIMNTFVWTAATVVFSFLLGLLVALIINQASMKLKGFWRSIIFLAWVIPGVVKATAWKWLFSNDGGMINHILLSAGLIKAPVPWLISPQFSMLALIIVQVWACAPYVMLMMSAGLQQISDELYENADLVGANGFQKTIYITLPMLKDITFICILLLLIWAINEFSLIWIMTNGGPGGSTTTLSLMVYNQFKVLNLNVASASAVMQLFISMLVAFLYIAAVSKED